MRSICSILLLVLSGTLHAQYFDWVEIIGLDGGGNDYGHDVSQDDYGNIYSTGLVKNNSQAGSGANTVFLGAFGDHDIYITKYKNNGDLIWAKRYGTPSTEFGHRINLISDDRIFLIGEYETAFSLDNNSISSTGAHSIFVARLDTSGSDIWLMGFGGAGGQCFVDDAFTDNMGTTYVLGHFNGTISIGSDTITSVGNVDVFLCKIDSSGTPKWARRYGGTLRDEGRNIKLNSTGKLIANGIFTGTAGFDGNPLVSNGNLDAWLAEIDTVQGSVNWIVTMGNTTNDFARGMALDKKDRIYVAGDFQNTLTISNDPTTVMSSGGTDIFYLRFDAAGNLDYAKALGGPLCHEQPFTLDVNDYGNIVMAYLMTNTSVINGDTIPLTGVKDWVFLELDDSANTIWYQHIDGYPYGGKDPSVNRVKYDNCGAVITTGGFLNTVDFNPYSIAAHGTASDVFIARLIPNTPIPPNASYQACFGENTEMRIPGDCYLNSAEATLFGADTLVFGPGNYNQTFSGNYDLQFVFDNGSGPDTLYIGNFIEVNPNPIISLGVDTTICQNASIVFSPGLSFTTYLWNDGSNGTSLSVSDSGEVFVSVTDNNGCRGSDTVHVSLVNCNDIEEYHLADLNIYPNPVSEILWLEFEHSEHVTACTIYDMSGNKIYIGPFVSQINVSGFSPGLYLLVLEIGDRRITRKFMR